MTTESAPAAPRAMPPELVPDVRAWIGRALASIDHGEPQAARAMLMELEQSLDRTTRDAAHGAASHRGDRDRSGLTRAERRVLPFLRTHLTLAQIGEQLFVSRNTVSTQTASIYRKLGVGARAAAVEEAIRCGLLPD
ncbi:MAG: LuxR C-terminal-related transcriptional regulator [Microbacterium sp.]|jgi:LuxR family maltose regulon positive regulatory protein|uniref:LuxR C-terminal-related transcriptional regulator n=1 Tax=Microbacterium sp. TaxID=51671 RepID=UPI002826AC2C|nr:LuxR C-terminal-related transcriptional regulator [Microbacterium sp.]MDR2321877.1 LuxR C-terminal-related transcriptional regulator [Microbacterium sp.]